MKKLFVAVMLFTLFAVPSFSQVYISGKLADANQKVEAVYSSGSTSVSENLNAATQAGLKLAVGFTPIKAVRTELEYGYYQEFLGGVSISTLMLNGYYDINFGSKFVPYIGAGAGIANIGMKGSGIESGVGEFLKDSSSNVSWNVGLGVGYNLNKHITFDFGVRYNNFGSVKSDTHNYGAVGVDSIEYKLSNIEGTLGVRYTF